MVYKSIQNYYLLRSDPSAIFVAYVSLSTAVEFTFIITVKLIISIQSCYGLMHVIPACVEGVLYACMRDREFVGRDSFYPSESSNLG